MPRVSVIMPVYNEAEYIKRSLGAVFQQTYPKSLTEIIVADGMSSDNTAEIVRQLAVSQPEVTCRIIANNQRSFTHGFNLGLQVARGDIIVMLGGHTIIPPDFISHSIQLMGASDYACVGGLTESIGESTLSDAISQAMSSSFGVGNVAFRTGSQGKIEVDTVAFGTYRHTVFSKYGSLDEEMIKNQDDELNYRLRAHGERILLDPNIRSKYYNRSTIGSLAKQYFLYGFWKVRVLQKHPKQMQWRQFIPPMFVLVLFASGLLSYFTRWGGWLLALVGGTYLLANFGASVVIGIRNRVASSLLLPVAFATLHFSYGIGFVLGMLKFWNRWGKRSNPTSGMAATTRLEILTETQT